jgi:hypothetical protein
MKLLSTLHIPLFTPYGFERYLPQNLNKLTKLLSINVLCFILISLQIQLLRSEIYTILLHLEFMIWYVCCQMCFDCSEKSHFGFSKLLIFFIHYYLEN